MGSKQKNALTQEDRMGDTPPWALDLFEKMKKEICAEVHACVAHTTRIMLDHLKDEILSHLSDSQSNTEAGNACYCKELKKCRACKEKKHIAKAATHWQRKVDKKIFKQSKRKVASESSDTDNEVQPMKQKSLSSSMTESITSGKQQFGYSTGSSVAENLNMAVPGMKHEDPDMGAKIINSSAKADAKDEEADAAMIQSTEVNIAEKESGKSNFLSDMESGLAQSTDVAEASAVSPSQSTPSDSEFEVVSIPPNTNASSYYSVEDHGMLTSDIDDTSCQYSETETETEFKDCKRSTSEIASDGLSQALTNLQLDDTKTIVSFMSSTTSSDSHATLHDGNSIEAEAAAPDNAISLERQRAPYSMGPQETEKINHQEEIINNQPLPSKFLGDRKPGSQAHAEPKLQTSEQQHQTQARPAMQTTIPPKPTPRSNPMYRVDHLPESLWDEALTVAAQTYNAAKIAVENLADTFVPGVERAVLPGGSRTVIPMPAATGGASAMPKSVPPGLNKDERKLYDMGFTDTARNAALLRRYNNDIQQVVQQLLES